MHDRSNKYTKNQRSRFSKFFQRKLIHEKLELRQLLASDLLSDGNPGYWETLEVLPPASPGDISYLNVNKYTAWSLNRPVISRSLANMPLEFTPQAEYESEFFALPTPDGTFARFEIVESPVMEPELALQFPEIKTYRGQGVDDPAATLRFDISPYGFHAQVLSPNGSYYIDPYWHLKDSVYISYYRRDLSPRPDQLASRAGDDVVLSDHTGESSDSSVVTGGRGDGSGNNSGDRSDATTTLGRSGTQLRTYRLANAATGEYTKFHGGSVAGGQAAIVTTVNRVTGIYEKEVAVRLVLVGNNSQLVYTDPATDPYTNDNGFALLSENQINLDNVIGDSNYDIGHVFGTGGGGLAGLGVVGVKGLKARGQTGREKPVGDAFDVDFVAHEMGHQFGGNHTFNGTNGSAAGNRAAQAAFEPGSGSTIMAYAGICGADDLQPNSDPYFHSYSFEEIVQYTTTGAGNAAAAITNTGNKVPRVYAGKDFVIPAATPFSIDAVGVDADTGDALTYQWEERDLGPAQPLNGSDNGSSPLFRSWNPSPETSRTLPRMAELLNNAAPRGEQLPKTNRSLNFRAIVRDNFGGSGGVNTDDMQITVVDTGVPFAVTSPNTAVDLAAKSQQTVTWNVAKTTDSPIGESKIDIWLSVDGGVTFPILLSGGTPNDGSESVLLPDIATTKARIKVAAHESIFFDVSNVDFIISNSANTAPRISNLANVWMSWNSSTQAIPFQISDTETPADKLLVTAFSKNGTLIPDNRIELSGSGANRTVRLRPTLREYGETRIFVGVTDDQGTTAFDSFIVYVEPTSSTLFGVSIPETSAEYVENSPPIAITSSAIVIDAVPGDYSTGTLSFEVLPAGGATDVLTLDYSRNTGLSQIGNFVYFNGTQIATVNRISDTNINCKFNASTTTEAIENLIDSIRFEARGDSPDSFGRSLGISLAKGSNRETTLVDLQVISVNDSPESKEAIMDLINEDDLNPAGTKVETLMLSGVFDLDKTNAKAIVITEVPITPGAWQFDVGGGFTNFGFVSVNAGLVLGPNSRLRFVPSEDFFGVAPALKYLALDTAYTGTVSTPTKLVYLDTKSVKPSDAISPLPGDIRQTVTAVNDPPVAVWPYPRTSVKQDALLKYTYPTNAFYDVDDTKLTYSVFSTPGTLVPNWLKFNPATLTFEGTPSNKDVGQIQLYVRAADGSGAYGDAPFIIDVINVNDAPTGIQLSGKPVLENRLGAYIGRLTASDPDPNDTFTWSIVDNPGNAIEVQGNDLYLTPTASFDFEARPMVMVTVRAMDDGSPQLSFDKTLTIAVEDVNEYAPDLRPSNFSITENSSGGTEVGRFTAFDRDLANQVRYRFFGAAPYPFLLSDVGVLTIKPGRQLDFETVSTYRFFVEAYDNGTPSLSTWASATILVENENEFPPDITTTALIVSESTGAGATIGRIYATDKDLDPILFSLLPSENRFSIDQNTGTLTVQRDGIFDYERSTSELVTVVATDATFEGRSTTKSIKISVTNANEAPTSVSVANSTVLTNISGVKLGAVVVSDPDGPTAYSIEPLDDRFEMVNGSLFLKRDKCLKESEPRTVTVPVMLQEIPNGNTYRSELYLQRIPNANPWRNSTSPLDVDRDGSIGPLDVLGVINAINSSAGGKLSVPREYSSLILGDVDVDGDGQATPLDVLQIVNAINNKSRPEPEGEAANQAEFADDYFAMYDFEFDPFVSKSRRSSRQGFN